MSKGWENLPAVQIEDTYAVELVARGVWVRVFALESDRREDPYTVWRPNRSIDPAAGMSTWTKAMPVGGLRVSVPISGGLRVHQPAQRPVGRPKTRKGYELPTVLALCLPKIDLVVWLFDTFEPTELAAIHALYPLTGWMEYVAELKKESDASSLMGVRAWVRQQSLVETR